MPLLHRPKGFLAWCLVSARDCKGKYKKRQNMIQGSRESETKRSNVYCALCGSWELNSKFPIPDLCMYLSNSVFLYAVGRRLRHDSLLTSGRNNT